MCGFYWLPRHIWTGISVPLQLWEGVALVIFAALFMMSTCRSSVVGFAVNAECKVVGVDKMLEYWTGKFILRSYWSMLTYGWTFGLVMEILQEQERYGLAQLACQALYIQHINRSRGEWKSSRQSCSLQQLAPTFACYHSLKPL